MSDGMAYQADFFSFGEFLKGFIFFKPWPRIDSMARSMFRYLYLGTPNCCDAMQLWI